MLKRFSWWFTYPIQSHNVIFWHELPYTILIYFELCLMVSSLEEGTCHLPIFLLCVTISLLASKCLVWQSPTPGIVIHFHQIIPPQLKPKISTVCLSTPKRVKILQKFPLKVFNLGRTWSNLHSKKKEVPMILSKSSSKEEFNKMTQKCFQKCEFISPSPLDICDPQVSWLPSICAFGGNRPPLV